MTDRARVWQLRHLEAEANCEINNGQLLTFYYILFAWSGSRAWSEIEIAMGVFRGGRPPNRKFFAPFKYSLSWFLPNHVYNLCRIAW